MPSDSDEFIEIFDRFEYFLSLAYGDLTAGETGGESVWAPFGSYRWRRWRHDERFREQPEADAIAADERGWGFLDGPLFEGRADRFLAVKKAVDAHLYRLPIS